MADVPGWLDTSVEAPMHDADVMVWRREPAHHSLHFGSEWHQGRIPERSTSNAKEHFFLDESP
ncbi:MAG: hypothetical protein AAF735_06525 [Myxococcota bacterium]